MPDFPPHSRDLATCRQQVQELRALLDSSADLAESVFHDFFEPRLHLRALIGLYNPSLASPDRLAWQYPIVARLARPSRLAVPDSRGLPLRFRHRRLGPEVVHLRGVRGRPAEQSVCKAGRE